MPFTLAHAAAGLPFRRCNLVWSAFFIGTFAPDIEYFVRLSDSNRDGHHFPGVITFTLPAAFVALWIFHSLVKPALVELAPEGLQRRLVPYMGAFRFGGPSRFSAILGSVLLGVSTHVIWDWFTHAHTWVYERWAWLGETLDVPLVGPWSHSKVLQYASTLTGLVALAIWFAIWYRKAKPVAGTRKPALNSASRVAIALGMLALPWSAAIALGLLQGHLPREFLHQRVIGRYLVILPISLLSIEVVLYGVLFSQLQKSEPHF